jgi:hypothetical protein
MKPYILSESYWGEVKEEDYQLAILPWPPHPGASFILIEIF